MVYNLTIYFLSVLSMFVSSYTVQQTKEYSHLINQGEISSETLWATAVLYYYISEEEAEIFYNSIDSEQVKNSLNKNSLKATIKALSFEFKDEFLLLAYLLNEPSFDQRSQNFDKFYQLKQSDLYLIDLNDSIVHESLVKFEHHSFNDYIFASFLLTHYQYTLDVIDRSFFSDFLDLVENISIDPTPLLNDLLLSAKFNSSYNLDLFDKIVELYPQLLELNLFPTSIDKRDLFWSLDYVMYQTGNIDKSLEVQRKFTIPLTEYLQDQGGLNAIYSSHGGYLYMLGKYQEARRVFQQALQWSDALSDLNLTRLYNNLSLVYFKTGESGKYIETQLQALEHAKTYDNYDHQISIFRNLHVFYRKNQNPALALSYINQAADLAESIENTDDLIAIYTSKAAFERSYNNDLDQALYLLHEAESLFDDNTSNRSVIRVMSEKADILNTRGDYTKSIELQNKIVDIGRAQSDPSIFLEALINVTDLELKRNNYGEASRLLRQFKSHDISVVDFSVLAQAKTLEAKLSHFEGDYNRANQQFKETADLVLERARYSADQETGYWTVESEYMQLFEAYADFLIERNQLEEAVQLMDRVKTINDASLLQNPLITSNQLSEEQLTKDRQISQEMEKLRRRVFTASGSERLELNSQLERLQAQKSELHRQDRSLSDKSRSFPIWSVQRTLSGREILLHITNINDNYYISKLTSSSVTIDKLEITNERRELFESAIESMVTGRTDLDLLYKVGQTVGIDQLSSNVQSIIMMADGYLHQIPLDVIPLQKPSSSFSYGSAKYLVEEIDTRNLNHLGEVFDTREQTADYEQDFSGFGVADFQNEATGRSLITLPRAPGEIHSISENLTRFTRKAEFTDLNATPATFRRAVGNSRILHMATHSEISESDPLFSRIHLVPDSESDDQTNQIFAYELFDLNLDSELIMLNSCESGGDRSIQGGGIMGISRALHYAGAQSLILNAWSVNDQFAAEFAKVFYEHINEGETKSRALQLTKIDFIKNSNANPHFWGPYILNGSNQPLIQKRGTNLGNWLVAVIFLAGFLLISRSRQQAA